MAIIISSTNNKWWVWKTSTVVNEATILADVFDKKVLVIDLDQQCNLSQALLWGDDYDANENAWELFKSDSQMPVNELIVPVFKNLDIIPGKLDDVFLLESELEVLHERIRDDIKPKLVSIWKEEIANKEGVSEILGTLDKIILDKEEWIRVLKRRLSEIDSEYDYIFLDLPPSVSRVPKNAWMASDYLLIPISDYFALKWTEWLIRRMIEIKRDYNQDLKFIFFFNKAPLSSNLFWKDFLNKDYLEIVKEFIDAIWSNEALGSVSYIMDNMIRFSADVERAYWKWQTLIDKEKWIKTLRQKQKKGFKNKDKIKVLEDYKNFAKELIEITEK